MPDTGYYDNERREVAALVPSPARMILDVGCGRGKLGSLLKSGHPDRRVYGIELDHEAAAAARETLDSVLEGDFQSVSLPFDPATFDCVVFADVLEHFVDPASALRRARMLLRPEGVVVCSIPNMRHYTVFLQLALHGWEYADYGLFDRTHLHFFSLRSMNQILIQSGFRIVRHTPHIVASRKMKFLNALVVGRLEEFLAQQYLILAQRDG
jgi:2-polyprenyl-3-methyl-5-hydroxy-6-metoxy-1,4-benzoquinol methylase